MKRRTFAILLAGAATLMSTAAPAQPRLPRLGILFVGNPEPAWGLFRNGLRALGYVEGQNIRFELRTAGGDSDRLSGLADELVRLKVDLIVAFQTPAVQAAKQATRDIPIVMATAGDPVATGLVASLARPGGNITGMASATAELGGKMLELLREMLPRARRVAVLASATDPFTTPFLDQIERGARAVGIVVQPLKVSGAAEFDAAFTAMRRERADAMIHQPSLPRDRAIELALEHRLPSLSPNRAFAEAGGLLSYTANLAEQLRRAAAYIDRILRGAKPAELAVQQPTKFELIVNLRTAKTLGLALPPSLVERADEVIE